MAADGPESREAQRPSVAAHPRAARSVVRVKSLAGLAGFLIGGYMSLSTGTSADVMLRALVAGGVCYVAGWAAAVFVWRRLVVVELEGRRQRLAAGMGGVSMSAEAAGGDGSD